MADELVKETAQTPAGDEMGKPGDFQKWFYEDESDETMGIKTMTYPNGSKIKMAVLSDGRTAQCRKLKGKDQMAIQRITDGDKTKLQNALASIATKIDDKPIVVEDLDELWYPDYTKIIAMSSNINFL